jgi:glucose dehydrogenase
MSMNTRPAAVAIRGRISRTKVRVGDNLYTDSVLILNARTGVYTGHYSLVPADFHDWDVAAAPVLVTTKGGKRVVAAAPKDGMLYVHDLDSGKRLYATRVTTRENVDAHLSTTRKLTPTSFNGIDRCVGLIIGIKVRGSW